MSRKNRKPRFTLSQEEAERLITPSRTPWRMYFECRRPASITRNST